jgi:hypothetical protein
MDEFDDTDPYDDDPYANDEPLTELAMGILEAHRENPATDDFVMLGDASLEATDAAYAALRNKGLVEYTDRMIEAAGSRRHTFQLTREGLQLSGAVCACGIHRGGSRRDRWRFQLKMSKSFVVFADDGTAG